jgi:flagellin
LHKAILQNFTGRPLLSEDDSISFQAGVGANQSISVDTQNVASEIDGILNINITSGTSVNDALSAADQALEFIGSARSELGATQNRFESVARVLTQGDIDAAESRGRIQDLDFAQATSQSVINNIRSQAALTVQAQANIQEGQALALLS